MSTEKVKFSAVIVQSLATFSIAYLTSLIGFVYAWPSYNIAYLQSNETVLSRPMTSSEISLLGSLTNIGALAATPFCGTIIDGIGRKWSAFVFGLPFVIGWCLILVTTSIPVVLIAMTIAGFGAAGQVVSTVYISEIADDSIRGGLASTTVSGYFVGLMVSYIFGGYLTYYQVLYAHISLSVLYMVLIMFLKDSPVYLLQKGREQEAVESIAFYRRISPKSKEVEMEINKLKLQLDPNVEQILEGVDDSAAVPALLEKTAAFEPKQNISAWRFLLNSKSSQRALATVLTMMFFGIMMGSLVLQVYAEPLLQKAAPSIPSNVAAILMAADFVLASSTCGIFVDRFGRKDLSTYTALISGAFNLLLGFQLIYQLFPHWVTVMIIYLFGFINLFGAATVPFILTAEVFLPEVRGLGNSMSMGCMWLSNFLVLFVFNPLVESVGLGAVFCGFSVVCLISAAYTHWYLPETKGLSADEIQVLFLKKSRKNSRK